MSKISRFISLALLALAWNQAFALGVENLNIQILNASTYVCKLIDHNKIGQFEYTSSIIPEFLPAYGLTSPIIIGSKSEMTLHYGCDGYGEATFHIKSDLDFYSKHKLSVDISPINMKATYQIQNISNTSKHILLRLE